MTSTVQHGVCLFCVLLVMAGCTRSRYRIRADRETYATLDQKTAFTPWQPQPGFTILPNPTSRFFDPTPIDDPQLPIPAPQLYAYQIPEMPSHDPARFRPNATLAPNVDIATQQEQPTKIAQSQHAFAIQPQTAKLGTATAVKQPPDTRAMLGKPLKFAQKKSAEATANQTMIRPAIFQPGNKTIEKELDQLDEEDEYGELKFKPIPANVWSSLPEKCLRRMFEFNSVREEYKETFRKKPIGSDQTQQLALEDIMTLGLVNSREYQTEKEILYSVALRLTFERFQFNLKFTPFNNGADVNYAHNRVGGFTANSLGIPTTLNVDKFLATGGSFLARFANNVLLTFNGPQGFAADIGSELLFDIAQPIFQRDVFFESLTQAERNVVYAARDFARFRKTFFRDIAFQYYQLLVVYRRIEIAAQNYFTNQRVYGQYADELRLGKAGRTRVQVDQLEQSFIESRSQLIRTCNDLERGLDNLKLAIGLPPELPLNLDLTELEEVTLRDEANVAAELVRRTYRILQQERSDAVKDREALLNLAIQLTRHLLNWANLPERVGPKEANARELEDRLATMLVEDGDAIVEIKRKILNELKKAQPPNPWEIFDGTVDLIDALQILTVRQTRLAVRLGKPLVKIKMVRDEWSKLEKRRGALREALAKAIKAANPAMLIPKLVSAGTGLLADSEKLSGQAGELLGQPKRTPQQRMQQTLVHADVILAKSAKALSKLTTDLAPITLDMDDGMLTALTQRFDLINQRGFLADEWRRIKLAGDDLKSVLNLSASHVIRSTKNRPFDFNFRDSETKVSLSFDAPLNRKAQRNEFRLALIDYQVALRRLIGLEDTIKVAVRNDLRNLQLDREQYRIAVSGAALAFERVESTKLQLREGSTNIAARDFLEAQRAKIQAISDVAERHFSYVQNRISLFVDLEALQVNNDGFWPQLYDENYQPIANVHMPPYPPYGTLAPRIWYSRKLKRMLGIPPGQPTIFMQPNANAGANTPPEEMPVPREAEMSK